MTPNRRREDEHGQDQEGAAAKCRACLARHVFPEFVIGRRPGGQWCWTTVRGLPDLLGVPTATIRPSYNMAIRSATLALVMSWVITIEVTPISVLSRLMSSLIASARMGSIRWQFRHEMIWARERI
jgi:hypothetical protein